MYNRLKTIILTILILITVYQMFELWFDDYSNRNFFYSMVNFNNRNTMGIEYKYGLEAEKTVISFGNHQYTVLRSFENKTKVLENELKKILNKIMSSEIYVTEEIFNMREFLDNKAILFEYPIKIMNISSIKHEYGDNKKSSKQIGEFYKIIVQPSAQDGLHCFFVDEDTKTAKKIKINYNAKELQQIVNNIQQEANLKIYNATEYDASKRYFSEVNFLPALNKSNIILNQTVKSINPFLNDGVVDEAKVDEYVNYFFDNPRAKWNFKKENGAILYADGTKSIKYDDFGVIEYVNSKATQNDMYLSFDDAYQIAMAFMEKDNKYKYDNLFLAKAEKISENEWKLGFNLKLDDYRYVLPKDIAESRGLKYPIEIVVRNSYVYTYKKFIRVFEFESNFETVKLRSYNEALDEVLARVSNNRQTPLLIKNMFLGYYSNSLNENPEFMWMLETDEKIYSIEAVKAEGKAIE